MRRSCLRYGANFLADALIGGKDNKLGFVFHLRDMSEENL